MSEDAVRVQLRLRKQEERQRLIALGREPNPESEPFDYYAHQRAKQRISEMEREVPIDPNPFPRIHLFRFPRRELALLAGAVGSAVLFERYGLSWSEGTLAAVPLVGGWVVSEVVGS